MDLEKTIEAILFVSGEPLAIKELIRLTGTKKEEVDTALDVLGTHLQDRGIRLIRHQDSVTLATAPEISEIAEKIAKERLEGDLTRSALETLAIILWKGKVSRASIDYVRGVNSAFALRTLLIRGLVSREHDPKDARVFLYEPTIDLLKYLGISSTKELPQFEDLQKALKEYD